MPRAIDPGLGDSASDAIDCAELEALIADARIDPRDEDGLATLGPALARLGRNRDFLPALAAEELKRDCARQSAIGAYGPQVFLLAGARNGFSIRANFWPAEADPVLKASGRDAFFYDLPHDHNFSFLTVGYAGPGYWSDYYEIDPAAGPLLPGVPAGLRYIERSALAEGRVLLYRAGRDVHAQAPPDAFSVSINILAHAPEGAWEDQRRFDLRRDIVAEVLTTAPAEALLTLAVRFGEGEGLARDFARTHPSDRMRTTALTALAGVTSVDEHRVLLEQAAGGSSAYAAAFARARLAEMTP
jgi:hypothetical protein